MYSEHRPYDPGRHAIRPNMLLRDSQNLDGKRIRKTSTRRCVDYNSPVIRYLERRLHEKDVLSASILPPTPLAALDVLPPVAYPDTPSTSYATKFVHASTNKLRCSINRVVWAPYGRRLITGSQSGEFTLWNGLSFNFEMILQAHDVAVRSMKWMHNDNFLVTGDDKGKIKYWQPNMNNVWAMAAHEGAVRDVSFSPTDAKFVSCSDDTSLKVFDFASRRPECVLKGHGWDVKSVDWHPTNSLIVSGGKDNFVKMWDARSARELYTFHGHKNTVQSVKWNANGNWILSASRDQTIKLFDVRTLKEVFTFRGHSKEVTALAWHPHHEEMFASGGSEGDLLFWIVGSIWDLCWHPVGHLLGSASNDHTAKFWGRARPGEKKGTVSHAAEEASVGGVDQWEVGAQFDSADNPIIIPGLG